MKKTTKHALTLLIVAMALLGFLMLVSENDTATVREFALQKIGSVALLGFTYILGKTLGQRGLLADFDKLNKNV
jgi:hypothetical protein